MRRRAAALAGLLLTYGGLALAQDMPQEIAFGRALFQGSQGFAAGETATRPPLPASFAACANCHGAQGNGSREGGSVAPAIRALALGLPQGAAGNEASQRSILAAIIRGEGRDGHPLAPQMPRYQLEPREQTALLAYLKIVGTPQDLPPGVSPLEIRLGTILPLSGPLSAHGEALLSGMQSVLASVNATGGVNGRRLRLVAIDSATADPARAVLAQDVLAVIGGMWDDRDAGAEAALAAARVSMIANMVVRAQGREPGPWSADLLPPDTAQATLLSASLSQCPVPLSGSRWLIGGPGLPATGVEHVFPTVAAFAEARPSVVAGGCIGFALRDFATAKPLIPLGWRSRIGLPFPRQVLDGGADAIWQQLGTATTRIAVEALAASGAALHERAPLDALPRLNGFEPLPGAPVRYSEQRRYGWDPDVIALENEDTAQTLHSRPDLAAHQEN